MNTDQVASSAQLFCCVTFHAHKSDIYVMLATNTFQVRHKIERIQHVTIYKNKPPLSLRNKYFILERVFLLGPLELHNCM